MPKFVNKVPRPIHVEGVLMVPGQEVDIPDATAKLPGFARLVEAGDVEAVEAEKPKQGGKTEQTK